MIKIKVNPRIHMGLISMHEIGYRKHGGIGFSIIEPTTEIRLNKQEEFDICDKRKYPLASTESSILLQLLGNIRSRYSLKFAVHITIQGETRHHFGLGMGTAIRLAVLEGLFQCNNRVISRADLVSISERGGTSGIGINTYFDGGLVFDLGIPNDGSRFQPSSRPGRKIVPIKLPSLVLPDWPMCICLPNDIETITQQEEITFFEKTAPIGAPQAYESCYHALFGIYSSVVERNFDLFCKAVHNLQQTEWKIKEWSLYGDRIFDLRSKLMLDGAACVGMSSLGPLVYCFGHEICLEKIRKQAQKYDCTVMATRFCNSGRLIRQC